MSTQFSARKPLNAGVHRVRRMSFNKKLALTAVMVAVVLVAVPAIAAAQTPWWVTVGSDTVTGAVVGAAAGGPIGALAGAVTGAAIGGLTVYFFNHQAKGPQANSFNDTPYAYDTIAQAAQQINTATNTAYTTSSLMNASYYYFSAEMESLAVKYINTSLNESQLAIASGTYQQLDNIQAMSLTPIIRAYMFLNQYGIEQMAGSSSSQNTFLLQAGYAGIIPTVNNYYYIDNNNTFAFWTNGSLEFQNVFTGNIIYVNDTLNTINIEDMPFSTSYMAPAYTATGSIYGLNPSGQQGYTTSPAAYGYNTGVGATSTIGVPSFAPKIVSVNKSQALSGLYKLISTTGTITTSALSLGSNWNGNIGNSFAWTPISFNTNYATGSSVYYTNSSIVISVSTNQQNTLDAHYKTYTTLPSWYPANVNRYNGNEISALFNITLPTQVITTENTVLSDAYSSAQTYVQELHNFGYTNYSQIPANETIPFPSWAVPLNLLNGHFNETELMAMYYAYLQSLNGTFHNNNNKLPSNYTFNDTQFLNAFTIETGTLNLTNSFDGYHNITGEFMVETNSQHINFALGKTTKFTALTPIIAINASLGDPTYISGDLIEASPNSTLYVTALSVNGTSVTSTSIYPAPITVVLSPYIAPIQQHNGGFFMNRIGPLQTWEWLLIGVIALAGVAAIYERRD